MKLNLSHNMTSEQRLVSEVKRGDRLAMRRLYDEYSGYAMSVGLRYVPDRDDGSISDWFESFANSERYKILTS